MATNTSDSTSLLTASHCIPWVIVLTTESLAIVILNLVTVIVFATRRQLQRRGTYLLIRNLAIVDLLAGGISGPLQIERVGEDCDMWENDDSIKWAFYLKFALLHLFSMASLGNLAAISLERMHATVCPSQHLFMNKWVYKVIIAVIWLTAVIREAIQIALTELHNGHPKVEILINSTLYVPYYLISLVLICVSYITIFMKVRFSPYPHPQCSGVISRERQLTSTLFVVTIVSLLTLLPVIIFLSVETFDIAISHLSNSSYFHIRMTVVMFFLANSLANPIIYSMRMQGFRAGLREIFYRAPNHVNAVDLPLRRL